MNNQDNYKKAIDEIHATKELKEKTIEKIRMQRNRKKIAYLKYLSACAVFCLAILVGTTYYNNSNMPIEEPSTNEPEKLTQMVALNKDLPRFESLEELEEVLKETNDMTGLTNGRYDDVAILESAVEDFSEVKASATTSNAVQKDDYSKTNVQVENVDEADIVKTDGNYIYYITQQTVYIIEAENLKIISSLKLKNDKESFSPSELYINNDKLIVIGNYYTYEQNDNNSRSDYIASITSKTMAEAIVYDIKNKENPEEVRKVRLDGNYRDSRMIGENVYLISSKNAYYYDGIKESEVLPVVYDTTAGENIIKATDIAYFPDTDSYSFMTVAGFDINNEQSVCTETFFGASDEIYASENNLYITRISYEGDWNYNTANNIIYKFKLDENKIELLCKGEVKGNLKNQFSMDEYNGNLRIATTIGYDDEATNTLYVLDENLKEIGKIENMAVGEKIYSVRFIGKIGYVVTFEQIDPLFVIDLSDPTNPTIKGELKIPGYSSYLHPYDETHIIGIGYNTKSNGYGGVTNANMKMSMFDVSDLENPVELFHVDIGDSYAYSDIMYNHKVLFENKAKNLIGFPITLREKNASKDRDAFVVYKIDLENGFERYGEISHEIDYRTNIDRVIYIGNTLYTLANLEIRSYNLESFEELQKLEFEEDSEMDDYFTINSTKTTLID